MCLVSLQFLAFLVSSQPFQASLLQRLANLTHMGCFTKGSISDVSNAPVYFESMVGWSCTTREHSWYEMRMYAA